MQDWNKNPKFSTKSQHLKFFPPCPSYTSSKNFYKLKLELRIKSQILKVCLERWINNNYSTHKNDRLNLKCAQKLHFVIGTLCKANYIHVRRRGSSNLGYVPGNYVIHKFGVGVVRVSSNPFDLGNHCFCWIYAMLLSTIYRLNWFWLDTILLHDVPPRKL